MSACSFMVEADFMSQGGIEMGEVKINGPSTL